MDILLQPEGAFPAEMDGHVRGARADTYLGPRLDGKDCSTTA
ncbi:MAG: hypothetical protein V4653_20920 [Pseudomonadota bacterium]